ncbi:uncharacterized protein LOC110726548 [Chenopodium quinoa]|nr:uncharacterized protein LOC110726548 [Chenopodium quinoa]
MAHNPTHRRKLATPDPPPQPTTGKRHLKPSTTATSTVYNLTNHFSRLRPNPTKPNNTQNPLPIKQINSQLQAKPISKSVNLDPSNQKFGKNEKRVVLESAKNKSLVVVQEKEVRNLEKESKISNNSKVMVVKQPSLVVNGMDKRRSFSDAKVELANFLVTNCAKVVSADMPPFMQIHAVGFARKIKDSLEKFTSKTLALSLKKELDGVYGPAWHCIVGTSFGSFVTHSVGGFLYFSLDQKLYVLIFKTTVQRAD